jgi:hypothetical protein
MGRDSCVGLGPSLSDPNIKVLQLNKSPQSRATDMGQPDR